MVPLPQSIRSVCRPLMRCLASGLLVRGWKGRCLWPQISKYIVLEEEKNVVEPWGFLKEILNKRYRDYRQHTSVVVLGRSNSTSCLFNQFSSAYKATILIAQAVNHTTVISLYITQIPSMFILGLRSMYGSLISCHSWSCVSAPLGVFPWILLLVTRSLVWWDSITGVLQRIFLLNCLAAVFSLMHVQIFLAAFQESFHLLWPLLKYQMIYLLGAFEFIFLLSVA